MNNQPLIKSLLESPKTQWYDKIAAVGIDKFTRGELWLLYTKAIGSHVTGTKNEIYNKLLESLRQGEC